MPKTTAPQGAPVGVPAFLTLPQVAERLNVGFETLRKWRRNGTFTIATHNPPGTRCLRFSTAEVDAWWNAQRRA